MSWIKDIFEPEARAWEDFYRNRWSYDKVVRSTHGVNCTGSCSWNIYVKRGIVTWEMQALDYPILDKDIPPYEPRGCQRGISYSWYIYSPLRVKYPYLRGAGGPLARGEAKASRRSRGGVAIDRDGPGVPQALPTGAGQGRVPAEHLGGSRGDHRRSQPVHRPEFGPDRLIGYSPIPAMSMISYAVGARFMQLMGGVALSFYDWYCDLPPASRKSGANRRMWPRAPIGSTRNSSRPSVPTC